MSCAQIKLTFRSRKNGFQGSIAKLYSLKASLINHVFHTSEQRQQRTRQYPFLSLAGLLSLGANCCYGLQP